MTTPQRFVSIEIEDEPGTLGRAARCLATANVNVEAFTCDSGKARLLTNNPSEAERCLRREGFQPQTFDAFEVNLQNRPGQLATLSEELGKAKVNIDCAFGCTTTSGDSRLFVAVNNARAAQPIIDRIAGGRPTKVATPTSR